MYPAGCNFLLKKDPVGCSNRSNLLRKTLYHIHKHSITTYIYGIISNDASIEDSISSYGLIL